VWATMESVSGRQVARAIGVSQREVPKTFHQDSRYREPRNADGVKRRLNSQLTRVLDFWGIGHWESGIQVVWHREW
jgi:hypothetical protein